ncbi:MAG TPA: adenylate/guanylate cyclase domain-containing protein [Nannocystis sp.]
MNQSPGSRGNVLVVDDTLVNLRILTEMLAAQGYKVRPVTSGPQALQAAAAAPPDLVLLDINMPGMTGYEVCQQLKNQPVTRDVPVIFMSARDEVLDKIRAFEVGGVDYVTKPFHLEELLARVATHVSLRALQRQLEESRSSAEATAKALEEEKHRTDELLHSMLPRSVAEDLRNGKQVAPDSFPNVTVLFCDIVDFTATASSHSPLQIFELLGQLFTRFDALIERHPVYKVETVGDCYMVAAGVPEANPQHANDVVATALDMLDCVKDIVLPNGGSLQLRIGVNSGPVVAGVVGTKMPRFCLFGDTVNIASRMETTSTPMCVQISETTRLLLDPARWKIEERGEIQLKGRGPLQTYFVSRA